MKKLTLALAAIFALATWTFAGPERYSGKEMKQVAPPPCPEFYADSEWNIGLWGAYAFSGDNGGDGEDFDPASFLFLNGEVVSFDNNSSSIGDSWGGGIDIKYFFHRYFGIGLEAFGLGSSSDDSGNGRDIPPFFRGIGLDPQDEDNNGGSGAILGTFTLRYPFHCSRFSPYLFAGGGVLFGNGSGNNNNEFVYLAGPGVFVRRHGHDGGGSEDATGIGQVGAGLEIRFTPHVGWITDFSWNFTGDDDFGMVRGGFNFAF